MLGNERQKGYKDNTPNRTDTGPIFGGGGLYRTARGGGAVDVPTTHLDELGVNLTRRRQHQIDPQTATRGQQVSRSRRRPAAGSH